MGSVAKIAVLSTPALSAEQRSVERSFVGPG